MGHLISLNTTLQLITDIKNSGRKIIFTHGAFDLFHAGHSLFLNESKKEGDVLIVGIDSDQNVKRYKSVKRPIINEFHRAEVVKNHDSVDFAFIYDPDTDNLDDFYLKLYKLINPDTLTMGINFAAGVKIERSFKSINVKPIMATLHNTKIQPTTSQIISDILSSRDINTKE